MPRIPTYDNYQVGESTLPSAQFNSTLTPEQGSLAGRQMMQTGQDIQRGASVAADIMTKQMEEANQLRVDDANNRRNEMKLKMLYDPQAGLTNIRGIDALERPDGKPLADEYGDKYKQTIAEIEATLGNDAQKKAFRRESESDFMTFYGTAMKHEGEQFREYALSVRKGTIANRINEIGLRYNDPEAVDAALTSIKANAYDEARLMGKSAAEAEAYTRELTSKAHVTAISTALEKGNALYADGYIKKYAKDMTADDILKVNGVLTKELDAQIASETVRKVMTTAAPRIETSEHDRAFNILIGAESGGKQFGADGKPLTSRAGAIGIAQVMPTTGPEAAKLAGVEWDENRYKNDTEYNRALGKAYFEKQLQDFEGNLPAAYAAYNAGPGATRKALDQATKEGGNWLSYLPKETQDYVSKNMAAYGSGGGKNQRPTLLELQRQVTEEIGTGNPERLDLALKDLERQFEITTKAIKQRDEENVATAMQQVIANGGSYINLPASVRSSIPAAEVPKVIDFAEKIAKGEDVKTDWGLYYELKSDTAMLSQTNLMAFRNKLGDTEFKQLIELQTDMKTGKTENMTRVRTVKDVMDTYMSEIGIDPNPKPKDKVNAARVGRLWSELERKVKQRETSLGRKLNPDEMSKEAASLFSNKATYDPGVMSFTAELPVAALGDDDEVVIPRTYRKQITEALESVGKPVNNKTVRETYLRWLKGDK